MSKFGNNPTCALFFSKVKGYTFSFFEKISEIVRDTEKADERKYVDREIPNKKGMNTFSLRSNVLKV